MGPDGGHAKPKSQCRAILTEGNKIDLQIDFISVINTP